MDETSPITLEHDVATRVPVLQDLFAEALEARCGRGEVGITAISRELGIHRKLAWQIRNVAYSPDPFQAVEFVPSRAGIETLAGALSGDPATRPISERLTEAFARFEELVDLHAGDRSRLEMLVASNPSSPRREAEARWREKAFLGNSFIWGVQAKVQLSINVLGFSTRRAGWMDLAQIRGLIGLQRVRPNTRWLVNQSIVMSGSETREPSRTPLDPDGAAAMGGVPILREHCSRPLPGLVRRPTRDQMVNDELLPAPVGSIGEQTIFTGEVLRELAPNHATQEGQRAHFGATCRTPAEVFLFDHFVHRDLFPRDLERELCVFSELNSPVTKEEEDRLPLTEPIERRGPGLNAARSSDVPGYLPMLESIFARLGWDPREFDLHRIRIAYPPMPATVVVRHGLPRAQPEEPRPNPEPDTKRTSA